MSLFHFFHVYADGEWEKPLRQHLTALDVSGLRDNLDGLFFGLVGSRENRALVKKVLPGSVVAESDRGWEQVTINALHEFSHTNNGLVLYGHTKGAWSNSRFADRWRETMIHDTVLGWRQVIEHLPPYEVAGAFWLRSQEPEHRHHEFFFAGNFWWADLSYVRRLPPVLNQHRFQAEGWIGLAQPNALSTRGGLAVSSNFVDGLPFDAPEI